MSDQVATTPDLSVAAYWHMNSLRVLSARRLDRRRYQFSFADPEGKADGLLLEFANSESARFDASQRSLKKLVTSPGPKGDDRGRH